MEELEESGPRWYVSRTLNLQHILFLFSIDLIDINHFNNYPGWGIRWNRWTSFQQQGCIIFDIFYPDATADSYAEAASYENIQALEVYWIKRY